jgi:hypothetical protein
MDPLFNQIEKLLLKLETDRDVTKLVEMVCLFQSPVVPDHICKLISGLVKLIHPRCTLGLLKFIHQYSKKDPKFFKQFKPLLPQVFIHCFQVSQDRESLELYLQSWGTNAQWKESAYDIHQQILLLKHANEIAHVLSTLDATDTNIALSELQRNPDDEALLRQTLKSLDDRLDVVLGSINFIRRIVDYNDFAPL